MMNTMEQIQRLKKHTLLLMQHDYVESFLEPPVFDEAKVFITYCLLRELELDEAEESEYFSSVLLIQSALDRHDNILNPDVLDHKKNRQLVVLSGDYFSSLYYLLLSRCENLNLISCLSTAVQQINEQKTLLHTQSVRQITSMDYMVSIQKIESLLYTKAAESFGLHKYIPFIERYLTISRFQKGEMRFSLNEDQLQFLKECERELREKRVEMPLLFHREDYSLDTCLENDRMLGEG
jgi:hypothetical protein